MGTPIIGGAGVAFAIPATMTDGKLKALGSQQRFELVSEPTITKPGAESGDAENIELSLGSGDILQRQRVINRYSMTDPTVLVGTGGAATAADTISFSTHELDPASFNAIVGLRGQTVFIAVPWGLNDSYAQTGWAYMLGELSGDLEYAPPAGDAAAGMTITFSGKETVIDAAVTGAPITVTPANLPGQSNTIAPPAITQSLLNSLSTGRVIAVALQ